MRQEAGAIVTGSLLLLAGLGLMLIPDLRVSGIYLALAGAIFAGMGYWFLRRGGNAPHPTGNSPAPAFGGDGRRICPACGSNVVRSMTPAESTAFFGFDRFVLVRPLCCETCGQGFEVPPSALGRSVMICVGMAGVLIGIGFAFLFSYLGYKVVTDNLMPAEQRIKWGLGVLCSPGVIWFWCSRSYRVAARYWND